MYDVTKYYLLSCVSWTIAVAVDIFLYSTISEPQYMWI